MKRVFHPLRLAGCAACFSGALAIAAAPGEAASGPVVELPRFVVTDSRELPQPESWRYAKIPGFEILSNAPDRATQRLVADFETFRQALGYVWQIPQRAGLPTALIVSGRDNKFDAFASADRTLVEAARASVMLRQRDRSAIVIDLQATTLNVATLAGTAMDDAAMGIDSAFAAVEHDKQLYREYIRYLLSASEPRLPAWLEEGLAQIAMKMRFDRRSIQFGRIEPANTVPAGAEAVVTANGLATEEGEAPLPGSPVEDRDFNAVLLRQALVPLGQFFAVGHNAPEALNPLGNNLWAKQAYAFVHLCLFGEGGRYAKSFGTFVTRLTREPLSEALFKECFNETYKQMATTLRSYIEFTVYKHTEIKFKQDAIVAPPPLAFRDATPAEIGRIKGETLTLAGKAAAARLELIAPYIRGERDPQLLAALGVNEKAAGQHERALKLLEAAVAGKAPRPDAHLELARYRFEAAAAAPGAPDSRFSPAQVSGILEPLLAGRYHEPALPALYELIADTWARSSAKPARPDAVVLIDGVRIFPNRLRLLYLTAGFCVDAGIPDAAHPLADHGIKIAPDPATKARFEQLKASLPPLPPVSAPAAK